MKYLFFSVFLIIVLKTEAQITYDNIIYSYDNAGNRNVRYKVVTLNKRSNADTTFHKDQNPSQPPLAGISKTNILVYPNPIKDLLTIDTEEPSATGSISVIDSKGSTVLVKKGIDNKNDIDLSFLKDGFYLVKLDFNGKVKTYSIIKQ